MLHKEKAREMTSTITPFIDKNKMDDILFLVSKYVDLLKRLTTYNSCLFMPNFLVHESLLKQ